MRDHAVALQGGEAYGHVTRYAHQDLEGNVLHRAAGNSSWQSPKRVFAMADDETEKMKWASGN
mgnify:FL=1